MKSASINEIKKEISNMPPLHIAELCMRLAKFKKENKEYISEKNITIESFKEIIVKNVNSSKYIEKTKENEVHYQTLRRQLDDLKRFDYYSPNCVPKIFNVYESPDEFYFDMEYLEHYEELIKYPFSIIKSKHSKVFLTPISRYDLKLYLVIKSLIIVILSISILY